MPLFRLLRRGLAVALVVLAFGGCDHTTDPDGPLLTDRFGPFRLVTPLAASQDAVDFAAGESIVFTAEFNKRVDWVVTITGQESGAVHRIQGRSTTLSEENAVWRGRTTELPFFKDETVEAVLTVPAESAAEPTDATIEVTTPRSYEGSVFADFEGDTDVFVGNFEFELDLMATGITDEFPAGEGDSFFRLRSNGIPIVADPFFIGLVDLRPEGSGVLPVPTDVPEDLYFNFMLRGSNDDGLTIPIIQLVVDGNGSGAYELDQDTVIPFGDTPGDFEGWRLFSKPLSALGPDNAPIALTQEQAANIVGVRLVLISDNNAQTTPPTPVEFGIDYITFTAGGPLQP